jgi:alkanesulfonate monooxygenase SsuD/methylene tetrahydromethanopterin reductase-like flavin-dependent oxidoreductase (luciferase family)
MLEGQEGIEWEQWLALALAAEAAGLDGLFRSDHYRSIVRGDPAGSLDAWATLAALAARTKQIRLGTMVSPVTFRSASVLAKSVVTVDHVSGGRVELGIGAGWSEAEHDSYGFPFLTVRERLDELDRQLAEIERQWTEAGDVWPKPVQKPRPPISVEVARGRRRILDEAARAVGREPLRFSMMTGCVVGLDEGEVSDRLRIWQDLVGTNERPPLVGTVEQVAETLHQYQGVGVERAMLQHMHHEDLEMVALLGGLATALA